MLRSHLVTLSRCYLVLLTALFSSKAHAHPVVKSNHDRTIVVRLQPGSEPGEIVVRVDYRLEVDPATVILEDMKPFQDDVNITRFRSNLDYFKEFTRIYAPILADRLIAHQNGIMVEFACLERTQTLQDEKGEPLDHLRCDFVFRTVLRCAVDKENVFTFRESNYQEQEGLVNLRLTIEAGLTVLSRTEPDEAVKNRAPGERLPGDEAKLRLVGARFTLPPRAATRPAENSPEVVSVQPAPEGHGSSLLRLLLDLRYGFWLLILASAGIGALHALTPGHGKTLVAAYLVGERGTLWHALLLGLVTTVTHTGVVLTIALVLWFLPAGGSKEVREAIQTGLGLIMGLVVVSLGFYLLLARLSGRADHVHIGGGHHHHHHMPNSSEARPARVSALGLIILGITGGLIPCWDAIAMLLFAVASNNLQLAFPMLLAFSAGLAAVLVLVGVLVVKFRNFAGSRWGEGRLIRALPIISAVVVTAMGFWLCHEAVNGWPPP
jgi:ABC-type nickel/cobalt efflux system permease component RcnA